MAVATRCAFCGKKRDDAGVSVLIAGPGVSICDACVRICQRILDNHANGTGPKASAEKNAEKAQGATSGKASRRKRR